MERISSLLASQQAPEPPTFGEILAPLETKQRDTLSGIGLTRCRDAYSEDPWAFERLAQKVLDRGAVRSPLGLLVRMVSDGEHRRLRSVLDRAAADARSREDRLAAYDFPSGDDDAPPAPTAPTAAIPAPPEPREPRDCERCGTSAVDGAFIGASWLCGACFGSEYLARTEPGRFGPTEAIT